MSDHQAPEPSRAITAAALIVAAGIVLSAMPVLLAVDRRPGNSYQLRTYLLLVDIPLLLALIWGAWHIRAVLTHVRRASLACAMAVLGLSLAPALLWQPSLRGAVTVARLLGSAAVAAMVASMSAVDRRRSILLLGALGTINTAVAIVQLRRAASAGLGFLGEQAGGVLRVPGVAPLGLHLHPHLLAWFAVATSALLLVDHLSTASPATAILACVTAIPAGLALSRTAVLASVICASVLAIHRGGSEGPWRRRRHLIGALVLAVGTSAGIALNLDGWSTRTSTLGGDPSSGRSALVAQARGLFASSPVLGVGPGRYVLELSSRADLQRLSKEPPLPVHVVPLLILVEGGVVTIPALLLFVIAGWNRIKTGGAPAWLIVAATAPFLLLDHSAWTYPQGMFLLALSAGRTDALANNPQRHRCGQQQAA